MQYVIISGKIYCIRADQILINIIYCPSELNHRIYLQRV